MARTCRQGGQTILVLSDAEMDTLHAAAVAFDLEPAFRDDWAGAKIATWERVADAIIPKR